MESSSKSHGPIVCIIGRPRVFFPIFQLPMCHRKCITTSSAQVNTKKGENKKNWRDVGGACPCQLRFVEGLFDDSGPTRGPFRLVLERHTLTPVRNEEKKRPSPFFHGLTRLMRSDRRTPPSLCWRFTHTHQKTHKTIKKIEQLWVNRCVYEGFRVPGLEGFRRLLFFSVWPENKHTKRTGSLSNVTSGSSFLPALLTTWKTSVLQASRGRVKVCEWHHQSFLLSFLVSLFDRVYWIS